MSKRGYVTIGVLTASVIAVYLFYRIKRDRFKKKCLDEGGALRGDWECNYEKE